MLNCFSNFHSAVSIPGDQFSEIGTGIDFFAEQKRNAKTQDV